MSYTMEQQSAHLMEPIATNDWDPSSNQDGQQMQNEDTGDNGQNGSRLKRKRILRACDACNNRRMKCNGMLTLVMTSCNA